MIRRPPRSTLFPYTRSSDLLRHEFWLLCLQCAELRSNSMLVLALPHTARNFFMYWNELAGGAAQGDRKSTRLNSSHGYISYAVFCLKKKINSYRRTTF